MKVFAKIGESLQVIYETNGICPDGFIEMDSQRPAGRFIASEDGIWKECPQEFPKFIGNQKLDLFTMDEQIAVVTAKINDPMVKLMYDRLIGSAYLTYEDPETEKGLTLLVSKGLLTEDRKSAIVEKMQPQ